jgi:hypothetical protein
MTEDDLLTGIVDAALVFGWHVHHVRRSDKARQMGQAGFPDLVLAKDGRIIFAELKAAKGQLDTDQFGWLLALRGQNTERLPGQPLVVVWRPADYDDAIELLRGNRSW